jgi:glutathione synthase/RimK-type ligase-like ATP-grasp enzyme
MVDPQRRGDRHQRSSRVACGLSGRCGDRAFCRTRPPHAAPRARRTRYDLAILHNPKESNPPSDEKALKKFERAGAALGLSCELITRDDYARLAEFDALFIRETTLRQPSHLPVRPTGRQRGLVVIDDPDSIVRCTNKVFLAELLRRHRLPMPQTMVVHKGNMDSVAAAMGMPCVLKQPDSAFSLGVVKVDTEQQLNDELKRLLAESELVIAQSFLPTTFDWRIGILDRGRCTPASTSWRRAIGRS